MLPFTDDIAGDCSAERLAYFTVRANLELSSVQSAHLLLQQKHGPEPAADAVGNRR